MDNFQQAQDNRSAKPMHMEDPVVPKLIDIKNALIRKGKITDEELPVSKIYC